jgi:hypothetical protein
VYSGASHIFFIFWEGIGIVGEYNQQWQNWLYLQLHTTSVFLGLTAYVREIDLNNKS